MHAREELFLTIFAIIFEELHELSLINDVKEGDFVLVLDLLGHFDCIFLTRTYHLVQCAG